MRIQSILLAFCLLLGFGSASVRADSVDIFSELQWGNAPLSAVVEVNGHLFGYSRSLWGFYLYSKGDEGWSLSQTFKHQIQYARNSALSKVSDDTVAVVSQTGMLEMFTVSSSGEVTRTSHDLGKIIDPQGSIDNLGGAFHIDGNKLVVTDHWPNALFVFELQGKQAPTYLTALPIQTAQGKVTDIRLKDNRLWLAQENVIKEALGNDQFTTLAWQREFQAPANEKFDKLGFSGNLLMATRIIDSTSTGYYFVDLATPDGTLQTKESPVFGNVDVQIRDITAIGNNHVVLTSGTASVIADVSTPQSPQLVDVLNQIDGDYGQPAIQNNLLYMPLGGGGFLTLDVAAGRFNQVDSFLPQAGNFRSIVQSDRFVYLNRFGNNVDHLVINKSRLTQVLSGEASGSDDVFDVSSTPACVIETEDETIGFAYNRVFKLSRENARIISSQHLGTLDEHFHGSSCVLIDGRIFVSGERSHLWSVPVDKVMLPFEYQKMDLTETLSMGMSGGKIIDVVSDGSRLFVVSNSSMAVIESDNSGHWAVSHSFNGDEYVNALTYTALFRNALIMANQLFLLDNNSGYILRFSISGEGVEFADVTPGVPDGNNRYGLIDFVVWGDYLIGASATSAMSIFQLNAQGALVRVRDVVIEDLVMESLVILDNILLGLNFEASLRGYSINEIVTSFNYSLAEDEQILAQPEIDGRYRNFALTPGEYNGQVLLRDNGIVYQPQSNFHGQTSISVTAENMGGSRTFNFTFDVQQVNDAPTADDVAYTAKSGEAIAAALVAQDVDADVLVYSVVSDVNHGTLTLDSQGNFNYVSDNSYVGEDSFIFAVTDVEGASAQAKVTLTITENNDSNQTEQPEPQPQPTNSGSSGGSFGWLLCLLFVGVSARRRY